MNQWFIGILSKKMQEVILLVECTVSHRGEPYPTCYWLQWLDSMWIYTYCAVLLWTGENAAQIKGLRESSCQTMEGWDEVKELSKGIPILDMRFSVCLIFVRPSNACNAHATPILFWTTEEWRHLVKDHIPKITKLRSIYFCVSVRLHVVHSGYPPGFWNSVDWWEENRRRKTDWKCLIFFVCEFCGMFGMLKTFFLVFVWIFLDYS